MNCRFELEAANEIWWQRAEERLPPLEWHVKRTTQSIGNVGYHRMDEIKYSDQLSQKFIDIPPGTGLV